MVMASNSNHIVFISSKYGYFNIMDDDVILQYSSVSLEKVKNDMGGRWET